VNAARAAAPIYYQQKYEQVKSLWLTVVARAIWDYAKWKKAERSDHRKEASSARHFIFDDDGGLVAVCAVFDLDLDKVRHRAQILTPLQIRKIERVDRRMRDRMLLDSCYRDDGDDEH